VRNCSKDEGGALKKALGCSMTGRDFLQEIVHRAGEQREGLIPSLKGGISGAGRVLDQGGKSVEGGDKERSSLSFFSDVDR